MKGAGRHCVTWTAPSLSTPVSPRMLTFSNNVEPANGFLVRYLRRKLLESDTDVNANKEELLRVLDWVPKLWYHLHTFLEKHSTSDFLIGMARHAFLFCIFFFGCSFAGVGRLAGAREPSSHLYSASSCRSLLLPVLPHRNRGFPDLVH